MDFTTILTILGLGVALSMDAFAVSICNGLTYVDINKKKTIFIAATFGLFQGAMPLIGYFIVNVFAGFIKNAIPWIAFSLLLFIGGKMIIEGIISLKKTPEEKEAKKFSIKEVLIQGVATSIDALAVGATLVQISTNTTVFLHTSIITLITFIFSVVGILLGRFIDKLLKGRFEISNIIGGAILVIIAAEIVISHYLG